MAGVIQFRQLGQLGRIGNQLFQYAFAKAYALSVGAILQTPPWAGQVLFENISDPLCDADLPTLGLDQIPSNDRTDINLSGYYQFANAFKYYSRSTVRQWFTLKEKWLNLCPQRVKIAAHIRRGDYVTQYPTVFCTIDEDAYIWAVEEFGYHLLDVTWVREDRPTHFDHPGLEWLQDFLTLMNAEVLFRANSTFSWWAGTLGPEKKIYSPLVENKVGHQHDIKFVEGNQPRCTAQPNTNDFILAGEK